MRVDRAPSFPYQTGQRLTASLRFALSLLVGAIAVVVTAKCTHYTVSGDGNVNVVETPIGKFTGPSPMMFADIYHRADPSFGLPRSQVTLELKKEKLNASGSNLVKWVLRDPSDPATDPTIDPTGAENDN